MAKVTRDDVARLAGTSTAVVSYVINNGPRPVAPATRERVLAAIKDLGYRPDRVAQAMASRRTDLIGLIVPDARQPFFAEMAHAVEQAASERGKMVLVGNSDYLDNTAQFDLGVSYLFDGGFAPYVSYATSFEPVPQPAVGDAPKPTTGEQWEAGIKYQPEGFDGFFSAAIYDLKQKNVTTTVGGVTQQMDEAHVKGLELEGVASLADGLDLRAAYTYMDSEVSGRVNNGKELDSTPRHAASLWLDYTFAEDTALEGFGIGGGVRYVGKRYGDAANAFEMKGLALLDLGVHYEKNGYRASLLVQNLTDKEYISSCSTFGCYYGDGRTVMGKLTYRW